MKPPVYEHIGKLQKTQKPYIFRCQVQAIAAAMQQRAEQLQLPMPRLVVGQNIARPGRVAGPKRLQRQREGLNQPKQANGHFCGESYGQVSPKFDRDGLRMFLQWFQISATDLVILVDFTVLCWQLVTGQCKEMETEKKIGRWIHGFSMPAMFGGWLSVKKWWLSWASCLRQLNFEGQGRRVTSAMFLGAGR